MALSIIKKACKGLILLLVSLLTFCLISCGEKNENAKYELVEMYNMSGKVDVNKFYDYYTIEFNFETSKCEVNYKFANGATQNLVADFRINPSTGYIVKVDDSVLMYDFVDNKNYLKLEMVNIFIFKKELE